MSEETKQEQTTESADKQTAGKSDMIKYIIFGLIAVVVVAGTTFGTLMLLGNDPPEAVEESPQSKDVKANDHDPEHTNKTKDTETADDNFDFENMAMNLEEAPGAMDNFMRTLEFLDYVPEEAELDDQELGMSVEDSLEKANWFAQEQSRLDELKAVLDSREKSLNQREQKVNKQMLKIEQAESSRIASLAKLYDGMDARAVAKLIANLDDATVVSIMPRMKQKNASAMLSLIPAKRAARLSRLMITIAEN